MSYKIMTEEITSTKKDNQTLSLTKLSCHCGSYLDFRKKDWVLEVLFVK